jgi:hypothetical protein
MAEDGSAWLPEENKRIGRAWMALCLALAVHVSDEALTGFLDVYNPTVNAIRAQLPWLPLPVFRFETWITGLIAAIGALMCVSVFVFQGARWTRPAGYAFAILMILNALGHTAGTLFGRTVESVRFSGPMPGFYSSPLLMAAAIYLLLRLVFSVPRGGSATA